MKLFVICLCINLSVGATIRYQGEPNTVPTISKSADQQVQRQLDVYSLNLYSSQNPLVISANIPRFPTDSTARTFDTNLRSGVLELPRLISQKPFKTNSFVLVPAKLEYSSIAASPNSNYNEQRGALNQSIKQHQSFQVKKKESSGYKIEQVPEVASFSRVGPQYDIPSISEIEAIFNNATRGTAVAIKNSLPLESRTSLNQNEESLRVPDVAVTTAAVLQQPIPDSDINANTVATSILPSEVSSQSQHFNVNIVNGGTSLESSEVASAGHIDVSNHETNAIRRVENTERPVLNVETDIDSNKASASPTENVNAANNIGQVNTDHEESLDSPSSNPEINNTDPATTYNTETTWTSSTEASRESLVVIDNGSVKESETFHSTENGFLIKSFRVPDIAVGTTDGLQQPIIENSNNATTIATNVLPSEVSSQSQSFDSNGSDDESSVEPSQGSVHIDNGFVEESEHAQGDHSSENSIPDNFNKLSSNFGGDIQSETTDSPIYGILRTNEIKSESPVLSHSASVESYVDTNVSDNETTDNVILSNTAPVFTSSYGDSSDSSNEINVDILEISKQVNDSIENDTSVDKNVLFSENADSARQDDNILLDHAVEANTSYTDQPIVETVNLDPTSREDEVNNLNEANTDSSTNVIYAGSDPYNNFESTTVFYSETTEQ